MTKKKKSIHSFRFDHKLKKSKTNISNKHNRNKDFFMKKLLFISSLALSSQSFAGVAPPWIVPSDYTEYSSSQGASFYKSNSMSWTEEQHSFNTIYVDLSKARLDFGTPEKTGNIRCYRDGSWHIVPESQDGNCIDDTHILYKTKALSGFPLDGAFAVFNGQFFNAEMPNETPLSYPLYSNGINYQNYSDRTTGVYSLIPSNGKYYVSPGYTKGNWNDLFVAWHRDNRTSWKDGWNDNYTHIGVIPKSSNCNPEQQTCELKALVIQLTVRESISSAEDELERWGVKPSGILRLDGGGSTQFNVNGDSYAGDENRKLPHMIRVLDQ